MGEVCKLKNIIYVYIDSRCHPLITSLSKALFSTEQQSMVFLLVPVTNVSFSPEANKG